MSTDLRSCRVRITEPPEGGFVERVTGITPFDVERRSPVGPALDPNDAQVTQELRELAQERVSALLRPQYEAFVAGPTGSGLQCIFDVQRPLVVAAVDLHAEVAVESAGIVFVVRGTSRVVRKYYDGILDEISVVR
jgi:hypothetical protein